MEYEVSSLENEQQFWDELDEIVSARSDSEGLIDNVLRAYLNFTSRYKDEYLYSDYDVIRCSYKLIASNLFSAHADYVRRQIIYSLLQEDDPNTLYLIASFLLFDGRQNEETLHVMSEEGCFPRLLELIQIRRKESPESGDIGFHRTLLDLLYEMSRIQRLRIGDLVLVDDEFIKCLFEVIEEFSCDSNDPYHYPVIRVLLVLNEQFMISAHDPIDGRASTTPPTNRVIKVLSMHGNLYKTFGENIILLINREAETSLQLLTLKLLYLIFTTPSTYEYFFTNDLHVLVDILIRNLLDLPEEATPLRHTYLRVLYPLLAHTQLKYPPHYKQDELRRMLNILVPGQYFTTEEDQENIHFEDVDDTTKRLVSRCANVEWLKDEESPDVNAEGPPEAESQPFQQLDTGSLTLVQSPSPLENETDAGYPLEAFRTISISTTPSSVDTSSPTRSDGQQRWTQSHSSHKAGLAQLEPATSSTSSVQEVAAIRHENNLGEQSSSYSSSPNTNATNTGKKSKVKPEPPRARRSRGRNITITEADNNNNSLHLGPQRTATPPLKSASIATTSEPATNRRNSVNASLVVPPLPSHLRRSVSHSPPVVPPPRRSVPSHMHRHPSPSPTNANDEVSSNDDNYVNNANNGPAAGINHHHHKHGPKPEPPRTRRHGRGTIVEHIRQTSLDSDDKRDGSGSGVD